MRRLVSLLCAALALVQVTARTASTVPSVDDLISLKRVAGVAISPDGKRVAYGVRETNWEDDRYQTQIWIADVSTGIVKQLTTAPKSSTAPAWSPDS